MNDILIKYLEKYSDEKFSSFSKRISNSDYEFIGIRLPILRKTVNKIKYNNLYIIRKEDLGKYFEIDFIYFAINLVNLKDIKKQLIFLKDNLKYAKSWMITDSITTYLKKISIEIYFKFFNNYYHSKYVYLRRMCYVIGLKFYKEKTILNLLPLIKEDKEYIVMMSQAWLISYIAIDYNLEVYNYLLDNKDTLLKRKTISKISDSFRFSKEIKDKFKQIPR